MVNSTIGIDNFNCVCFISYFINIYIIIKINFTYNRIVITHTHSHRRHIHIALNFDNINMNIEYVIQLELWAYDDELRTSSWIAIGPFLLEYEHLNLSDTADLMLRVLIPSSLEARNYIRPEKTLRLRSCWRHWIRMR